MSDYKAKRLKKKNDLENALQSTRQDLYNWKEMSNQLQQISPNKQPSVNSLKSKTQLSSFEHRFNSFDSSSGSTFNHSSSAKDFNKQQTKGKMSCSKARSIKSKQKNKGNHTAKAAQRYLNYHCQ
jgi:hypothetical protein